MAVRVGFFASLRTTVGEPEIIVEVSQNSTARSLFQDLKKRFPELGRYEPVVLVAVNQEYASWDTPVRPGDEVVFFPPVSGGRS